MCALCHPAPKPSVTHSRAARALAQFYMSLALDEKKSTIGYCCIASVCVSLALLAIKTALEVCTAGRLRSERALHRSSSWLRSARSSSRLSLGKPDGSGGGAVVSPASVELTELQRQHTSTKARALRVRSWYLHASGRLCLAIVLLEDLPQLIIVAALGRLDPSLPSSRATFTGIAVSFTWALINLGRGRLADWRARGLQEREAVLLRDGFHTLAHV